MSSLCRTTLLERTVTSKAQWTNGTFEDLEVDYCALQAHFKNTQQLQINSAVIDFGL